MLRKAAFWASGASSHYFLLGAAHGGFSALVSWIRHWSVTELIGHSSTKEGLDRDQGLSSSGYISTDRREIIREALERQATIVKHFRRHLQDDLTNIFVQLSTELKS